MSLFMSLLEFTLSSLRRCPSPLPTGPYGPGRCDRYASLRFSVNLDPHSHGNLINYSSRVPVCQADAPVAGRTTDRIPAVGTMNADALFVHTDPDDPNRITWTRCDSIKVAASPSMLQHCFVPAENRHCRDFHNFPSANRRRQAFRSRSYRKRSDDPVCVDKIEHSTSCINSDDALSELRSWRQIRHRLNSFDLERLHIGYLDRAAFFQIVQIPTGIQFPDEGRISMKNARRHNPRRSDTRFSSAVPFLLVWKEPSRPNLDHRRLTCKSCRLVKSFVIPAAKPNRSGRTVVGHGRLGNVATPFR